MSQIVCKELVIGYDRQAIAGPIDFEVNKGDYLCLIGENGAGKSTLMKNLLHITTPLSGSIIFGDDIKQSDIGYLPQQTVVQKDFPASVWEIVISGCQSKCGLRPFYNKKEKELALENMKKMGIENLKDSPYRYLSGGQQQRVLLARALCAASKILLLDEPVAGLDPSVTEDMYTLIDTLNKEGITIIMITHDTDNSIKYASHILHLGENFFFGRTEEYLAHKSSK